MKYLLLSAFAFLSVFGLPYESCISHDCAFGENIYNPGDNLTFACFSLICNSARNWVFIQEISSYCDSCYISDDPHFRTFDTKFFDWHGTCNYSISQPYCDYANDSYNPPYGIFGDFIQSAYNPDVTCVKHTTYKLNQHTVMQITHQVSPPVIEINGNLINVPLTPGVPSDCDGNLYPVVLWRDGNTVRIVGEDYSIQAVSNLILIYTPNWHQKEIGGLCGHYTGNVDDDFQGRDCDLKTDIPTFANSWLTQDQKDKCSYGKAARSVIVRAEKCENEAKFRETCSDTVKKQIPICGEPLDHNDIQHAIENCVKDCCANPDTCDTWVKTAAEYICNIGKNDKMQENGKL